MIIPEIAGFSGTFRHEKKFVLAGGDPYRVDWMLRNHPMLFSPVFPERRINNIYLDSVSLEDFHANQNGYGDRIKLRVRWYGELFGSAAQPTLEVKFKKNMLGAKVRFPLPSFPVGAGFGYDRLRAFWRDLPCSDPLRRRLLALEPTLMNTYRRKYYRSFDRRFMMTVDEAVEYFRILPRVNSWKARAQDRGRLVLELKYDGKDEAGVADVLRRFPFRIDKNSKYVRGLQAVPGA